jgi:hypothetical protein
LSTSQEAYWEAKDSKDDITARKSLKIKEKFYQMKYSRSIEELSNSNKKRLTGFPEGGVAAAAAEGIFFPLEREEAVDIWVAGIVAGAEASEAARSDGAALVLDFLGGGSMKSSSLQK